MQSINYYEMQHQVDNYNSLVISAHMRAQKFDINMIEDLNSVAFLDKNKQTIYGNLDTKDIDFDKDFYLKGKSNILISTGARGHLGIFYVVLSQDTLFYQLSSLKYNVFYVFVLALFIVALIGWFLSRMFLRPLREKINQIETFIKDISHELNTPITSLLMSISRLKIKKTYDEKILRNISISTKQLYDTYRALTYINFDSTQNELKKINFKDVVNTSIEYFDELLESKNIQIQKDLQTKYLTIDPYRATMLINNLLSNAVKYSYPNSKIKIILKKESLSIKDYGIGIDKKLLKDIFTLYKRASSYAGGFGVGLSVVKSICDEYDFDIKVASQENSYTKIDIFFNGGEEGNRTPVLK